MKKSETEPSECRKRVAERWGKVEYREVGAADLDDRDSENSTDTEIRATKRVHPDVIDLTKSDDEEETAGAVTAEMPFKLMRSDLYDVGVESSHLITLKEILGSSSLKSCVLFSFQFEMDFLLENFHAGVEEITIVGQKGTMTPLTSAASLKIADKLHIIEIYMPPYTCHHSKMVISFFQNGSCKIYLPSSNFTYAETNYPQQVCWSSPVLMPCPKVPYARNTSRFQDGLIDYLRSYGQGRLDRYLIPLIKTFDFAPLKTVQFIYSTPSKNVVSGLKLLADKLQPMNLKQEERLVKHYLCQTSSVGSAISKKTHGNLFTHVFIPLLEGLISKDSKPLETEACLRKYQENRVRPYLIYPTVEEIRSSPSGWLSSGWFHFNHLKNEAHYKILLDKFGALYKQNPKYLSQERKATPSHSKFYFKSTTTESMQDGVTRFDKLDWCVYTSSNLSFNAWGNLSGRPRNYEVGVLFTSAENDLRCESFNDVIYNRYKLSNSRPKEPLNATSMVVMVPFTLPPLKYQGDEAFCISKNYDPHE